MAYKYYDFECPSCGNIEERMVTSLEEEQVCLEEVSDEEGTGELLAGGGRQCGHVMQHLPSKVRMNTIVRGNHDYAERERERLTKRSNEHFQTKGKDEARDREREQMKKIEKALS